MTYIALYIAGIAIIWWIYREGWSEALKIIISVLIPSFLIILFNIKAGRLLFKNPVLGIFSTLPTAIFIYQVSKPFVYGINNWISRQTNDFDSSNDVVDTEVISKEDA